MPPPAPPAAEEAKTRAAARRRAVTAALGLGGLCAFGLALACANGPPALRDTAVRRWGDYATDDLIEADNEVALGLIMSADAWGGGRLVSYEYFHEGELFVGYQRVEGPGAAELATGEEVEVELWRVDASRARLAGTLRAPAAGRTRVLDRWILVAGGLAWPTALFGGGLCAWAVGRLLARRQAIDDTSMTGV